MNKVRNAVIIIILCIIGAGVAKKVKQNQLGLPMTTAKDIQDVIAGRQIARGKPGIPENVIPYTGDAGKPILIREKGTNTLGDIGAPPRGQGNGSFAPLPNNPAPPVLSPSGPNE